VEIKLSQRPIVLIWKEKGESVMSETQQYTPAVEISCDFGDAPTNECCLGQLAYTDEKFAELLPTNGRLRRAFHSMTCHESGVKSNEVDEVDRAYMVFVEYALLNRARFACTQKWNFAENYRSVQEDEETTLAIVKCLDMELKYIESLLHRCNSEDAMKIKVKVEHWLSIVPGQGDDDETEGNDDHSNISEDGSDNSQDEGEDGGNGMAVLIPDDYSS